MRLQVANSTTTVYYSVTNAAPAKPYLQISNQYLPLTTATLAGIKLKVQSGNTSYRACVYQSGYYNTTSAAVGNLSSTTALTRASTSATLTRASTSATLTRASTSATLTRASTSATLTRASTSGYGTRSSISGYGTRSSISGYGTTTTTSATTETWWNGNGDKYFSMTTAAICSGTALVDGKTCTLASCLKYSLTANTNSMTVNPYFQTKETYGYPGDGNISVETVNYNNIWMYRSSSGWDTRAYIFYTCTFTDGKSYTLTTTTSNTHGSGWEDGNPKQMLTYRFTFTNSGNNRPPTYLVNQNFGSTSTPGWAAYIRSYTYRNWSSRLSNDYNRTSSYGMPVFKSNGAYYTSVTLTITYKHCFSEISITGSWNSYTAGYNKRLTITTATLTRASTSATFTRASRSATLTRSSISGYGTRSSISGYATRSSISGYGTRSSISGYATRSSISGYGTCASTSGYSGKLSSSKWA